MAKLVFSRLPEPARSGWMVEMRVPVIGAKEPVQRLFAVGADDRAAAERLTRQFFGTLHCSVTARVRLSARVLAGVDVGEGELHELESAQPARRA